jgi:ribosomal protein S18 acetylase RimI-like enzyme
VPGTLVTTPEPKAPGFARQRFERRQSSVPPTCEADLVIRGTDGADWQRLRDLRLRALATDPDAFLASLEWMRELPESHWRERATPSETQVTLVEDRDGDFVASVAAFVADDPDTAYLVGMWVAPEVRGTGIAVLLVEHVLHWAREHGRTRVVLSVKRSNTPAVLLYAKCGFVEIARPAQMPYEPSVDNRFYAFDL